MILRKIRGVLELFRPDLSAAAGICAAAGEIIALGRFPSVQELLLGFVCGFFISSPALILNDYFDIEVDRVNAPHRPLPSGIISPTEAVVLTVVSTVIALAAAYSIGIFALVLCIFLWIIGVLYNWRLKETGLLGNIMVACSVASTFVLGGAVVGAPWNKVVLTFSLMAFFFDLGEEIAADAMDMEGDKKRGSRSIAIVKGRGFALNISAILFLLVVLVSLAPVLFNWLGISYMFMILISDIIIISSVLKLLRSRTNEEGRTCIKQLYRGQLLGLLAFIFSQLLF